MSAVERIEQLDDPRLDVYRDLRRTNGLRDQRLFVAEGPTVVQRLLSSHFTVRHLLISDRKYPGFAELIPPHVTVLRMTTGLAEQLVGFPFHCGVIACAERRPDPALQQVLAGSGPVVLVAGEHITDPENSGALIRIASAFGAAAAIFSADSTDPFSRRVLRVSMGNGLFLPVLQPTDFRCTLEHLIQEYGFQVIRAVLDPAATQLSQFEFPERTVLVFGNEYHGVSETLLQLAGADVTIPMLNGTDSLNVAVSSGIFLHQYRSQWPGTALPSDSP